MENYRDTPLSRFSAFWWGSALIFAFGIAVIGLRIVKNDAPTDFEQEAIQIRLDAKAKVDAAQAAAFEVGEVEKGKTVRLKPEMVFPAMTKTLLSAPAAVKKPEELVPGTPTFEAHNKAAQ